MFWTKETPNYLTDCWLYFSSSFHLNFQLWWCKKGSKILNSRIALLKWKRYIPSICIIKNSKWTLSNKYIYIYTAHKLFFCSSQNQFLRGLNQIVLIMALQGRDSKAQNCSIPCIMTILNEFLSLIMHCFVIICIWRNNTLLH